MKRLLSWLLALVMIISCLPMSAIPAFAAEEDTDPTLDVGVTETTHDWEVDIDEVDREYIDLATVAPTAGASFNVTLDAGETVYYRGALNPYADTVASINGADPVALTVEGNFAYLEITNNTEAEATYTVVIDFPTGHRENPVQLPASIALGRMGGGYNDTAMIPAGDGGNSYYFYEYVAEGDGVVTMYITDPNTVTVTDEGTGEETEYDYVIEMLANGKSLLDDGVDDGFGGKNLELEVTAGEPVSIQIIAVEDHLGNYAPAAKVTWFASFEAKAGTEGNPIVIEWTWNDDYSAATATVEAIEDGAYYAGISGMDLTANGVPVEMTETGAFTLAAGTYELVLSTPVGQSANPEEITVMPYEDTNSLAEDGNYNYIWSATEDGKLTLDITDGANITADVLTYSEDGEVISSEQHELAVPEIDENWNYTGWTVAENLVIDVVAGQDVKIQVNGLTDWSTWTTPAIEYTLNASFEAAKPALNPYFADNGASLIIEGLIRVNAYVGAGDFGDLNRTQVAENGGVLFWNAAMFPGEEGAVFGTETSKNALVDTKGDYKGYPEYTSESFGIAAKEYTDTIYYRAYVEVDGTIYYGPVVEYSVYQYATAIMTYDVAQYVQMRPLVAAMLRYGALAQVKFNYNKDNMADKDMDTYIANGKITTAESELNWNDSYLTALPAVSETMAANFVDNDVISISATSLNLEGEISYNYYLNLGKSMTNFNGATMNVYFWTPEDFAALEKAGTALTVDNASYSFPVESSAFTNSSYGYETSIKSLGIATKSYEQPVYMTFCVTDNNGDSHCSGIKVYSAEQYSSDILTYSQYYSEQDINIAKWITVLGERAKAYFAK